MQPTLDGSDAVLTLAEAAMLLRVSEKTLGAMARQGRVPCQRVGREWRFLRHAVQDWLAGETVEIEVISAPTDNIATPSAPASAGLPEHAISGCRDTAFTLNKDQPLHRWVPWIAGFSSSFVDGILAAAINEDPSDVTVMDPFAGVGTTLVQALKRGYNILGFEINPYAYLACKSKLRVREYDVSLLKEEMLAFQEFMLHTMTDPDVLPRTSAPPKFVSRSPFFSPTIQRQVLFVLDFIASERVDWVADLFRLALGAQMVSFSNYTYEPSLGTRQAAGKPDILHADVAEIILHKVREMACDVEEAQRQLASVENHQQVRLVNGSCLEPLPGLVSAGVNVIITSPPYLNNYHYLRNTRPQLHWLDLMPDQQKHKLEGQSFGKYWQTVRCEPPIGLDFSYPELSEQIEQLRSLHKEKGPYGGAGWANYASCYFNDTHRFCDRMATLLKPNGLMVVVIGNNILQGIEFQTDRILARIAEQVGFETINIHTVRTKRTGSSILNSSTRVGATSASLYETAVELRWRGSRQ